MGTEGAVPFMNSQMNAALSHIQQLLGSRFVRVDDMRPRVQDMDNADDLDFLTAKGAARHPFGSS